MRNTINNLEGGARMEGRETAEPFVRKREPVNLVGRDSVDDVLMPRMAAVTHEDSGMSVGGGRNNGSAISWSIGTGFTSFAIVFFTAPFVAGPTATLIGAFMIGFGLGYLVYRHFSKRNR